MSLPFRKHIKSHYDDNSTTIITATCMYTENKQKHLILMIRLEFSIPTYTKIF